MNAKGEAIRLQCTLCHALPKVASDKGVLTVQSTVSPDMTPPGSHEEPNWMHDHRTHMDSSCAMCHGKIQWGTDGGGFCSNPACHGRKWPEMNLDAKIAAPADGAKPAAPAKAPAPAKSDKAAKAKAERARSAGAVERGLPPSESTQGTLATKPAAIPRKSRHPPAFSPLAQRAAITSPISI